MANASAGMKQAKPILSLTHAEARRRVMNLYRAWYRQLPFVIKEYDVPVTLPMLKNKLREKFDMNRRVNDLRAIDLLIFRGQMELVETGNIWKQKNHIMYYFQDTYNPRPSDFMGKFLDGHDP